MMQTLQTVCTSFVQSKLCVLTVGQQHGSTMPDSVLTALLLRALITDCTRVCFRLRYNAIAMLQRCSSADRQCRRRAFLIPLLTLFAAAAAAVNEDIVSAGTTSQCLYASGLQRTLQSHASLEHDSARLRCCVLTLCSYSQASTAMCAVRFNAGDMKREHDADSEDEKQGAKKACSSATPLAAAVPEAVHLAAAIGRISHRPAMVVVDLDYTLFPCYAHEQTSGPYARGGLDEVLCINKRHRAQGSFALFPGVRASLHAISMQNIRLALASRSPHPLAGRSLLQTLELLHLFEQTHMIARAKDHHFRLIHEASGIDYQGACVNVSSIRKQLSYCSSAAQSCDCTVIDQTAIALSGVTSCCTPAINVQRGHTR
jgi:Acid Phosphatase